MRVKSIFFRFSSYIYKNFFYMEAFGIIETIQEYCTKNNIVFVLGEDPHANAELDQAIATNQFILVTYFKVQTTYENGVIVQQDNDGILAFGRKAEQDIIPPEEEGEDPTFGEYTEANLDETPIQKYNRRLKDLMLGLSTLIATISCENELLVERVNMAFKTNSFDLNADFVATEVNFKHIL